MKRRILFPRKGSLTRVQLCSFLFQPATVYTLYTNFGFECLFGLKFTMGSIPYVREKRQHTKHSISKSLFSDCTLIRLFSYEYSPIGNLYTDILIFCVKRISFISKSPADFSTLFAPHPYRFVTSCFEHSLTEAEPNNVCLT